MLLRSWRALVRISTCVIFVAHFSLTAVYVLPVTPLKIVLQPLLYATIGRYFSQNWSFFAPNPVSSNYSLLVHPLRASEASAASNSLPSDGWYDLTSPVWQRFQQNRLSAYERVARPQANGIRGYVGVGAELMPWVDACSNGDEAACTFARTRSSASESNARRLLARIASSFCNERFPSAEYVAVAVRVRQEIPPPWSQRHGGEVIVRDREVGIFPIDRTIVASGIYDQ